jgi:hypothetical protein
MNNDDKALFNSMKRWFRKHKPSPIKYRVILCDNIKENTGETIVTDEKCLIRIKRKQSLQSIIDTYLHEVAHVFTHTINSRKDHSQEFWIVHGELYDEYLNWINRHPNEETN